MKHQANIYTFCYVLLLLPILAYSQHRSENMSGIRQEVKRLKNFSDEPIYQIRVNTAYSFTILINGIPIANKNVPYLRKYFAEINACIPSRGEQRIEIQIYPRYTDLNTQNESLEAEIDFELTIEQTAWKDGSLEEPETIYMYRLPEGDYSGQKAFIHSDVFNADVPYELIDWRKGQTFGEQDTAILKKRALQIYEELTFYYENQRGADYVDAMGRGLFNLYQSSYFDEGEALDHLNHSISFINKSKRKLAELADYELQILANGKLLSLRRTDGYNRGEGVLRRYYKKGPKDMVHVYDVLLYAPRSSSENDRLEVIWHNSLVKGAIP